MRIALAYGVPVAAFPVPRPQDVIEPGVTGVLHADLAVAISAALRLDGGNARRAPRRSAGARPARSSSTGWRRFRRRGAPQWLSGAVRL
jgi:hypothetical protein